MSQVKGATLPGLLPAENASQLAGQLRRWDTRRRMDLLLIWAPRGLAAGILLALALALLARTRPLMMQQPLVLTLTGLGLAGLLVALLFVWLPRRTTEEMARFADRRYGLQERATTAVELLAGRLQTTDELAQRQLADALAAIARLPDDGRAVPRPNWREVAGLALLAALLITVALLPNPQQEILAQRQALDQAIEAQVENLIALADQVRADPELTDEQESALLQPIDDALADLQAGGLSQEEAVAVLSETAAEFRDLARQLGDEGLRSQLAQASQSLTQASASRSLAEALQNGDLAAASLAANQLADTLDGLSGEALDSLAERLAEAAASLAQIDPELAESFAQAAEALEAGDAATAEQAIRQTAGTFQQRALEQAAARRAQEAADRADAGRQALAQAGPGAVRLGDQPGDQAASGGQGSGAGSAQSGGQPSGAGSGNETGQGAGGPGPGGGHSEEVFAPESVDLSGEAGVSVALPAECLTNPALCGALLNEREAPFRDEASRVPYEQVFGQYRDNAYEALDQGYVPLGLKEFVRDYFSSLEP